jgi:hypothetical protein
LDIFKTWGWLAIDESLLTSNAHGDDRRYDADETKTKRYGISHRYWEAISNQQAVPQAELAHGEKQ